MELLKEAVPKAALIAVLWNANDQGMTLRYREIEKAARALQVEVQALGVREPDDFAAAFSAMTRRRPDAMFLVADGLTTFNRKGFVEFAAMYRIPQWYEWNFIVQEGGLMSYGVSMEDSFRQRLVLFIDRIFKGASPSSLAGGATDEILLHCQSQDGGDAGIDDSPRAAASDGRRDQVERAAPHWGDLDEPSLAAQPRPTDGP